MTHLTKHNVVYYEKKSLIYKDHEVCGQFVFQFKQSGFVFLQMEWKIPKRASSLGIVSDFDILMALSEKFKSLGYR